MDLPDAIQTRAKQVPSVLRTVEDALRLIELELGREASALPRWTFARDLLRLAQRSGKKRDLNQAYRQLRQALSNDKLLDDDKMTGSKG
jgi:hypothetical protein